MTIDNYSIVLNSSGEHGKINKSGAIAEKKWSQIWTQQTIHKQKADNQTKRVNNSHYNKAKD